MARLRARVTYDFSDSNTFDIMNNNIYWELEIAINCQTLLISEQEPISLKKNALN